jgi:hypothetical protein
MPSATLHGGPEAMPSRGRCSCRRSLPERKKPALTSGLSWSSRRRSPAVIGRLAAGLGLHTLIVDRHRAAVGVHGGLPVLRDRPQLIGRARGGAIEADLIVIGDIGTRLARRQRNRRAASHGLVVAQVRRVVALHELLHFQQAALGGFTTRLDDVVLVGGIGDRREDRDDQHDDDHLDQRETLDATRRYGCV